MNPEPGPGSSEAVDAPGTPEPPGNGVEIPNPRSPVHPPADQDPDLAPAPGSAPAPTARPASGGAVTERPALPPTVAQGPIDLIGNVLTGAVGNVASILRPEAALAVATEFTFPLALALAVLLFLVVQHQVDRRDPKLREAPRRAVDTFIQFQTEDRL